jgi:hypothetical protein
VAAMIKDPAFVADMKGKQQEINPASAEELQGFLDQVGSTPQDIIDEARRLLELNEG